MWEGWEVTIGEKYMLNTSTNAVLGEDPWSGHFPRGQFLIGIFSSVVGHFFILSEHIFLLYDLHSPIKGLVGALCRPKN